MKKLFALLLALTMLFSLTACLGDNSTTEKNHVNVNNYVSHAKDNFSLDLTAAAGWTVKTVKASEDGKTLEVSYQAPSGTTATAITKVYFDKTLAVSSKGVYTKAIDTSTQGMVKGTRYTDFDAFCAAHPQLSGGDVSTEWIYDAKDTSVCVSFHATSDGVVTITLTKLGSLLPNPSTGTTDGKKVLWTYKETFKDKDAIYVSLIEFMADGSVIGTSYGEKSDGTRFDEHIETATWTREGDTLSIVVEGKVAMQMTIKADGSIEPKKSNEGNEDPPQTGEHTRPVEPPTSDNENTKPVEPPTNTGENTETVGPSTKPGEDTNTGKEPGTNNDPTPPVGGDTPVHEIFYEYTVTEPYDMNNDGKLDKVHVTFTLFTDKTMDIHIAYDDGKESYEETEVAVSWEIYKGKIILTCSVGRYILYVDDDGNVSDTPVGDEDNTTNTEPGTSINPEPPVTDDPPKTEDESSTQKPPVTEPPTSEDYPSGDNTSNQPDEPKPGEDPIEVKYYFDDFFSYDYNGDGNVGRLILTLDLLADGNFIGSYAIKDSDYFVQKEIKGEWVYDKELIAVDLGFDVFLFRASEEGQLEVVIACPHDSWTTVHHQDPTCSEDGWNELVCDGCGTGHTEWLPATGKHDYKDDGHCADCGQLDPDYKPDEPGDTEECKHRFREKVIEQPTCSKPGLAQRICGLCKHTEEVILPPNDNHHYGADGLCLDCGAKQEGNTDVEPDTSDDPTPPATSEPGSTQPGTPDDGEDGDEILYFYNNFIAYDYNSDGNVGRLILELEFFGDFRVNGYVYVKDSDLYEEIKIDNGYLWSYHKEDTLAIDLGFDVFYFRIYPNDAKLEIILPEDDACPHDQWTPTHSQEPTCSQDGFVEYVCANCGTNRTDWFPATGKHNYKEDGHCADCGQLDPNYTPDLPPVTPETCPHESMTIIHQELPDCEKNGFEVRRCDACGFEVSEVIPAPGHFYMYGECLNCGKSESGDETGSGEDITTQEPELPDDPGVGETILYFFDDFFAYDYDNDGKIGRLALTLELLDDNRVRANIYVKDNGFYEEFYEEGTWKYRDAENLLRVYLSFDKFNFYYNDEFGTLEILLPEACSHPNLFELERKDSTCIDSGIVFYRCNDCDTTFSERLPILDYHVFDEYNHVCIWCGTPEYPETACPHDSWSMINSEKPTCSQDGFKEYRCDLCGETRYESLPTTGEHAYNSEGWCHNCDQMSPDYDPECSHSYRPKTTVRPNCISDGIREFTCMNCGYAYTETIPANGKHEYPDSEACIHCGEVCTHSYIKTKIIVSPTCIAEGLLEYYCANCKHYSYTESIPMKDHHHLMDGVCIDCGWEDPNYVPPVTPETCPHDAWTLVDWKTPSCMEEGYDTYACEQCGMHQTKPLPPTGEHNYWDGVCKDCGLMDPGYLPPVTPETCPHTNRSAHFTQNPTCMHEGWTEFVCDACGDILTEYMPPMPELHQFEGGNCVHCGATDPNGVPGGDGECQHQNAANIHLGATCQQGERVEYNCMDCGYSWTEYFSGPRDHLYQDGSCWWCGISDPTYEEIDIKYHFDGDIPYDWDCDGVYGTFYLNIDLMTTGTVQGYSVLKDGTVCFENEEIHAWYEDENAIIYVDTTCGQFRFVYVGGMELKLYEEKPDVDRYVAYVLQTDVNVDVDNNGMLDNLKYDFCFYSDGTYEGNLYISVNGESFTETENGTWYEMDGFIYVDDVDRPAFIICEDGKTLTFTEEFHPGNGGGTDTPEEIYIKYTIYATYADGDLYSVDFYSDGTYVGCIYSNDGETKIDVRGTWYDDGKCIFVDDNTSPTFVILGGGRLGFYDYTPEEDWDSKTARYTYGEVTYADLDGDGKQEEIYTEILFYTDGTYRIIAKVMSSGEYVEESENGYWSFANGYVYVDDNPSPVFEILADGSLKPYESNGGETDKPEGGEGDTFIQYSYSTLVSTDLDGDGYEEQVDYTYHFYSDGTYMCGVKFWGEKIDGYREFYGFWEMDSTGYIRIDGSKERFLYLDEYGNFEMVTPCFPDLGYGNDEPSVPDDGDKDDTHMTFGCGYSIIADYNGDKIDESVFYHFEFFSDNTYRCYVEVYGEYVNGKGETYGNWYEDDMGYIYIEGYKEPFAQNSINEGYIILNEIYPDLELGNNEPSVPDDGYEEEKYVAYVLQDEFKADFDGDGMYDYIKLDIAFYTDGTYAGTIYVHANGESMEQYGEGKWHAVDGYIFLDNDQESQVRIREDGSLEFLPDTIFPGSGEEQPDENVKCYSYEFEREIDVDGDGLLDVLYISFVLNSDGYYDCYVECEGLKTNVGSGWYEKDGYIFFRNAYKPMFTVCADGTLAPAIEYVDSVAYVLDTVYEMDLDRDGAIDRLVYTVLFYEDGTYAGLSYAELSSGETTKSFGYSYWLEEDGYICVDGDMEHFIRISEDGTLEFCQPPISEGGSSGPSDEVTEGEVITPDGSYDESFDNDYVIVSGGSTSGSVVTNPDGTITYVPVTGNGTAIDYAAATGNLDEYKVYTVTTAA